MKYKTTASYDLIREYEKKSEGKTAEEKKALLKEFISKCTKNSPTRQRGFKMPNRNELNLLFKKRDKLQTALDILKMYGEEEKSADLVASIQEELTEIDTLIKENIL